MAYTDLTTTKTCGRTAALNLTAAGTPASVGGDQFANNGRRLLRVRNADVAGITLTVNLGAHVDGQTPAAKTYPIPAGGDVLLGPWPTGAYNQTDGKVRLDYTAVTSVSVDIIEVA